MKVEMELLTDRQIYNQVIRHELSRARKSVVLATALIKQTILETASRKPISFCELVSDFLTRGIQVTVLFSGRPSMPFIKSMLKFPHILEGACWRICPRSHIKMILVDNRRLYLGSANLTGAGMGLKGRDKRNFEFGLLTSDRALIRRMKNYMDGILSGKHCHTCKTRQLCRKEHTLFQTSVVQRISDRV